MFRYIKGKKKVGVIRGGPSSGYHMSLKTGGEVLKNLPEGYYGVDIFIDREGVWHLEGVPRKPESILSSVEIVFNALHGEYGEDGKVQRVLEAFGTPYTGSSSFASSLAMGKVVTKKFFKTRNIKTPYHKVLTEGEISESRLLAIYDEFPKPFIVKPAFAGVSVGVSVVKGSFKDFQKAVTRALVYSPVVLIEEYLKGKEVVCGVLDSSQDQSSYSLLPVQVILPEEKDHFDYMSKCTGSCQIDHKGDLTEEEREELQRLAFKVHKTLGLKHYSASDFIITPSGVYLLEVNSLPSLAEHSPIVKSLKASGCEFPEFLEHLLVLAERSR